MTTTSFTFVKYCTH